MKNKDALNEELIETKIYLKEDFRNKQEALVYKVTAPDGHSELFRQALSENCQHMKIWQHCGCMIERDIESREVRSHNINGIQLEQPDLRTLVYTTKGKARATENYSIIKKGLQLMGIEIESHECNPYVPKKKENNCHTGTMLDKKYTET